MFGNRTFNILHNSESHRKSQESSHPEGCMNSLPGLLSLEDWGIVGSGFSYIVWNFVSPLFFSPDCAFGFVAYVGAPLGSGSSLCFGNSLAEPDLQ